MTESTNDTPIYDDAVNAVDNDDATVYEDTPSASDDPTMETPTEPVPTAAGDWSEFDNVGVIPEPAAEPAAEPEPESVAQPEPPTTTNPVAPLGPDPDETATIAEDGSVVESEDEEPDHAIFRAATERRGDPPAEATFQAVAPLDSDADNADVGDSEGDSASDPEVTSND